MFAPLLIEREILRANAIKLVAKQGAEHAQRVADFHRALPMKGASYYPNMIEDAISASRRAAA